jgi:hypothetical protein
MRPRPSPDRLIRRLVLMAGACLGVATALLAVLHLDPRWGGGISPITGMLSEYGLGRGWWLWDLALVLVSIGSAAVLVALRRTEVLLGTLPLSFLVLWCVAIGAVAVFTKDPQGGAETVTGKLHLYATGISCGALPLAGLVLGRRHRTHPRWRGFASWTRFLSLSSVPFFVPFIVPFAVHVLLGVSRFPTVATGLVERIMAVLELSLLAVLKLWARFACTPSGAGEKDLRPRAALAGRGAPANLG